MSPQIEAALQREIDATSLSRGRRYAAQGNVRIWELMAGGRILTADVDGRYTYGLQVALTWTAAGKLQSLTGSCACPVGHNCKHVAAAMIAADEAGAFEGITQNTNTRSNKPGPWAVDQPLLRAELGSGSGSGSGSRSHTKSAPRFAVGADRDPTAISMTSDANEANDADERLKRELAQYDNLLPPGFAAQLKNPELDFHLREWLSAYTPEMALARYWPSPTADEYPPGVKDRVRYIVNQKRDQLLVHAVKVSVRKDGSISSSASSATQHYNHGNVNLQNPPLFVLPMDVRIFRLFRGCERALIGSDIVISDDAEGQRLFELLLATNRTYWDHLHGLPLHWGDPCRGDIVWRDMGDEQRLMVRTDENTWLKPLPLTPPWYLNTETGECGLLESELSGAELKWLASAPPVPAQVADQVSIAMQDSGIELPRPAAVKHEHISDIEPVPVLTLSALNARPMQYSLFRSYQMPFMDHEIVPLLRLSFDYDGLHVNADGEDSFKRHVGDAHVQVIERNAAMEAIHLLQMQDLAKAYGFIPAGLLDEHIETGESELLDLMLWPFDAKNPDTADGGAREALDFLEQGVPQLQAQGWKVIIDEAWPCQLFDGEPEIEARVGDQDDDWFSLALNFEVDGQQFDLLPTLANLVDSLDEKTLEDDAQLQVKLAGRRLNVRLSDGRYARLPIDTLLPVLRFIRDLNHKMHAAQAGTLRDLADALAGCGVAFDGGERLIELGRRISELGKHNQLGIDGAPTLLPAPPETFTGDLRPYQTTGMSWMLALADTGFGGVLADDMGLGKTVQTLAFLASRLHERLQQREQNPTQNPTQHPETDKKQKKEGLPTEDQTDQTDSPHLPCLLVVPTSLVSNWQREAARFVPNMRVLALHGPDRKDDFDAIGDQDLVITTYPLLHRDHEVLFDQTYDIVILDEAQNVKNPTSQAAKLIREVSARQRLALTGTPMENNLEELWCLFDWLIPGLLGNRKSFNDTFRKPIEREKNLSRQVVLSKRIAPFLMRRTKDQVVTDLPPRSEMIENVQLVGSQRALYETVRATMHERVRQALSKKGLASSKITVLDALLKLRQACCDPQLLKLDSAKKVTASAKRSRLMEMLESLIAEGRRVLVFSQFVEMLKLIEADIKAQGWDYLMLTGKTKNRGDLVDAFQSGKVPLFLISLKAGGVGLNLTAADTVILYDPWWNPAIERQAMDRVHRIGQDKPVFVHRLIAEGTVETRIAEMQARKQALMDSVFDPEATGNMDMSEEEILSLFAPIQD